MSLNILRLLTVVQGLWFVTNTIFRAIQHLTITNLELTTLTFILMMFFTSILWWRKPAQVETAIVIEAKVSIAEILERVSFPLINASS
jgi:hypothetical protein